MSYRMMRLVEADEDQRCRLHGTTRSESAFRCRPWGPSTLALSCIVAVALAGCGAIEDGARIDVDFEFEGRGASSTDSGYEVSLDWVRLTVSEVEVVPCEPTVVATILRDIWPIRAAHAHTQSTATLSGSPVIVDLAAPSQQGLAQFYPGPGRFCGLRVLVTPADPDTTGLSDPLGMLGRTFSVGGRWTHPEHGEDNFVVHSSIRLERVWVFEPVVLDPSQKSATLKLSCDARGGWFDGVDWQHTDSLDDVGSLIVQRVLDSLLLTQ